MAATGPKALKQDVDDVDIYTDLSHNDDVSLEFSPITAPYINMHVTVRFYGFNWVWWNINIRNHF